MVYAALILWQIAYICGLAIDKMPLMSLPTEVHRMILLHLDHPSLLNLTSTDSYFRGLMATLPDRVIARSVTDHLRWIRRHQNVFDCAVWTTMWKIESTHLDFLHKSDMIPCYGCFAVLPSARFGSLWLEKRLTELDGGVPLLGTCLKPREAIHHLFHMVKEEEYQGASCEGNEDRLLNGCGYYLGLVAGETSSTLYSCACMMRLTC